MKLYHITVPNAHVGLARWTELSSDQAFIEHEGDVTVSFSSDSGSIILVVTLPDDVDPADLDLEGAVWVADVPTDGATS